MRRPRDKASTKSSALPSRAASDNDPAFTSDSEEEEDLAASEEEEDLAASEEEEDLTASVPADESDHDGIVDVIF